jgi:cysteinyl-tRNA synthetase
LSLKVYNTISRKKEEFITIEAKKARMYVCGPTVYNYISIGNARPIIVFSTIRNYLEHSGYSVDFVQNITDIEDKIIRKANEEGVDFNVITERYIKAFLEDIKRLDVGNFTAMPKASEMMPEIISIISRIIENGFGYESAGDVYFDIAKFKKYGRLSGQKTEEMHSQEEDSFSKKSGTDFTLWKSAKPGEPFWESPWGNGRPGWHIECSAMSIKYLKYGLDIHGGGIDLIFPHHENEIAQSEAAFPSEGDFVKYWMHNGMIEVKEEKMSKSKGLKSDWILRNLLDRYSANVIKMYMLSTHYRSPLEFSNDKLEEAKKAFEKIVNFLRNLKFLIDSPVTEEYSGNADPSEKIFAYLKEFKLQFKASMDDDFNSAKAIGDLFDFIRSVNAIIQSSGFLLSGPVKESLKMSWHFALEHGRIFGFDFKNESSGRAHMPDQADKDIVLLNNEEIEELVRQRNFARKAKDFKKSDEIRDRLKSFGIILDDRKEGTLWRKES